MIKSGRMRWAGHIARMGERRCVYRVLEGKPEGKRPLGRPRRRWDNIKMGLQEVGWRSMNWVDLAQDRDRWRALLNAVMNLRVPLNGGNFLTSWATVSFSKDSAAWSKQGSSFPLHAHLAWRWSKSTEICRKGYENKYSLIVSYVYWTVIILIVE